MNNQPYRPQLAIYVVWHPEYKSGQDIANYLYSRLRRNIEQPISRGLGIDMFFRSDPPPSSKTKLPIEIKLDAAQHSVIVALVDNSMVISKPWKKYLSDISEKTDKSNNQHQFYPVSVSSNALKLKNLSKRHFIRLDNVDNEYKSAKLTSALMHELCRFLLNYSRGNNTTPQSPAPVQLFISHDKESGVQWAEKIRNYTRSKTLLDTFFDANDIAPGYPFEKELEANIQRSVVVIFQTDAYASREWCQREIIMAKQYKCPIVVVNVVNKGEKRNFPYLGNVPTLRCERNKLSDDCIQAIIDLALYEMLKHVYFQQYFENLRKLHFIPKDAICLTRPPELLSLLNMQKDNSLAKKLIFYPEPPIGEGERELLSEMAKIMNVEIDTFLRR